MEGNPLDLDLDQITGILDGKRVIAPKNDIQEILNANKPLWLTQSKKKALI